MSEIQTINCIFETETSLYLAYMPFLKAGGLFVRSNLQLSLQEKVKLNVQIPKDAEIHIIDAQVAWITPRAAQANKPSGLGFQFKGESSKILNNKIEALLAGMLKSSQLNDTM